MAGYTPEEEWSKVLSNLPLFDEVLNTYGDEIISEYGSYKNINPWLVTWRKRSGQRFYSKMVEEKVIIQRDVFLANLKKILHTMFFHVS